VTVFTLDAPMAAAVLPGGSIVRFEAISPTTGLAITGVAVTTIAIYGYDRADEGETPLGPFMLVPGPPEAEAG
jgi:hypothetical protein